MDIEEVVEGAAHVHKELGEEWTESIYHRALERELSERGVAFSSEGTLSVMYKGVPVGRRRPDLFVESDDGIIVVELKAGSNSGEDQLIEYLDLVETDPAFDDLAGGILIQFNDAVDYTIREL